MTYNQTKIDETVLATLLLTLHEENRAWKGDVILSMSRRDISFYVVDIFIAIDKVDRYTSEFTNPQEL